MILIAAAARVAQKARQPQSAPTGVINCPWEAGSLANLRLASSGPPPATPQQRLVELAGRNGGVSAAQPALHQGGDRDQEASDDRPAQELSCHAPPRSIDSYLVFFDRWMSVR